jgi:hypothetical protein
MEGLSDLEIEVYLRANNAGQCFCGLSLKFWIKAYLGWYVKWIGTNLKALDKIRVLQRFFATF